ncbi:uncharacterized protein HaLaN_18633 [Haematococcus lacustris]|uniref:Uncharacterized protein n=1 Tax=Haematococcus lacustris TaxID=44745 RepID=A0A699ZNZ4_HAELA|nr:uncharacterized protein HaLaN_18633 [Haematococcus lacustris]
MVKKKFIDKKKATTFTLTFRQWDSEGEEDGVAREQSTAEGGVSERIWEANCEDDLQGYHMPADKRKEILELGLPDDGYDYLQHLQALPGSTVKAPAQACATPPAT